MKKTHIHWHRYRGELSGLFLNRVYTCRCGSRRLGVWL